MRSNAHNLWYSDHPALTTHSLARTWKTAFKKIAWWSFWIVAAIGYLWLMLYVAHVAWDTVYPLINVIIR